MKYFLGLFSLVLGVFYLMWNWLIVKPHNISGGMNVTDLMGFIIVSTIFIIFLLIIFLSKNKNIHTIILIIATTVISMNIYVIIKYKDCFTEDGASIMSSNPAFIDAGQFMPSFINYTLSLAFAVVISFAILYRKNKICYP